MLALPLPVYDLVMAKSVDDAVARALLAKRNPVLVRAISEAKAERFAQGKAEAVVALLRGRGVHVSSAERRILATRELTTLDDWLLRRA